MADEVVVTTYKRASVTNGDSTVVYGDPVGGQVLDIATASGVLSGDICRVKAKGSGFWLKTGTTGVSAAADTDGNTWLADGDTFDFELTQNNNYLDTAADA